MDSSAKVEEESHSVDRSEGGRCKAYNRLINLEPRQFLQ